MIQPFSTIAGLVTYSLSQWSNDKLLVIVCLAHL